MADFNSNYEIAQEISARLGTEPIPFESIYSLSMNIYRELGGSEEDFDDVYSILLEILPLAEELGHIIDDTSVRTDKTWSSSKINTELSNKQGTLTAGENIDITNNTISAKGYKFNGDTNGGFAEKYKQDATDGGQVVENTATGLGSHAEGYGTSASGDYGCHAEGNLTQALGYVTHAEGNLTKASETASHAEGGETEAKANYAHAEGYQTKAIGHSSHTEGGYTKAKGLRAHAEGEGSSSDTICAVGDNSHTEGLFTQAQNYAEHAQGAANVSHKTASNAATTWQGDGNHTLHSIGNGRYTNTQSNAVEVMQNADVYIKGVGGYDGVHIKSEAGYETVKTLQQVISGKQDTLTAGQNIVITNNTISAIIDAGISIEIVQTLPQTGAANTIYFVPLAGGTSPNVYDEYMCINNNWEKIGTTEVDLSNYYNKSEVNTLLAGKQGTLTAGANINITTNNSISAIGYTYNSTTKSFAVGNNAVASGMGSTAFGSLCQATGDGASAIGSSVKARGINSIAFGGNGTATGNNSFVVGRFTSAENNSEAGIGSYNNSHKNNNTFGDSGNTALSVGIGTSTADKKNAVEVMQNGDAYLLGVGNYDGTHIKGETGAPSGLQTLQEAIGGKQNTLGTGDNIDITNNTISALGYEFNPTYNSTTNGDGCYAEGDYSHAEGYESVTYAGSTYSHAEGVGTETKNINEHAQGRYNVSHSVDVSETQHEGNTIVSVGIGDDVGRKNAFEIMQNGDIYVYGVGNYDGTETKYENPDVMTLQDILKTIADAVGVNIGALI